MLLLPPPACSCVPTIRTGPRDEGWCCRVPPPAVSLISRASSHVFRLLPSLPLCPCALSLPPPVRLLDRYGWDEKKVCELYRKSVARRSELGLAKVKADIVDKDLKLETLPHAAEVKQVIAVNGMTSLEKPSSASTAGAECVVDGKQVAYGDVIGCYELRYGHGQGAGSANAASTDGGDPVTPQQFTQYMVYVTQWRWLQCENYIRRHGELGFWSMIHDCSCPAGYVSLWSRMRNLLGQYMPPVEEACAGLFPPMVQKILIINVPRIFSPMWSVIAQFLPQHHKDRIVLLSTSYTSAAEVSKYVPESHMPKHLREGRPDGPDDAP